VEVFGYLVIAFILVVAPLSYYFGVDSRRIEDRGWMAAPRR
jgi:hypothetical protein